MEGSNRQRAVRQPILVGIMVFLGLTAFSACQPESPQPTPQELLIAKGERIFFNETFNGNGRTCGTCHRREDNFAISPNFIATLPATDALFVAEFNPDLRKNFEKPQLMRQFGLILENLDGFDDLENKFVLRGVPHVLAQRTSINSPQGPRTGWSGDGAPGDGTLRSFAVGAVIQHFPRTLNRIPGIDFRLPTPEELDALEAFMLSLGRQQELALPLPLKGTLAKRGQAIFMDNTLGKCNICHNNAGANAVLGGNNVGNANFNTGVEDLPDQPARLTGERVPRDDGFGTPGDGTFNTPPMVEAADTGPFFHNNSIETIEGAVAFYNGDSFNNSPSGQLLARRDSRGVGIRLDATQLVAVAAFLRVINTLENIRQSLQLLRTNRKLGFFDDKNKQLLRQASEETADSVRVLSQASLHPKAVLHLRKARKLTLKALRIRLFGRHRLIDNAIREQKMARTLLIDSSNNAN